MINLNDIMIPDYNKTKSNIINRRAKLDTGYRCNYSCNFCYYFNNLNDKEKDIVLIKKDIDQYVINGINEIDLSGGESSIHSKWFEILQYCHLRFSSISTLSNGSKFHNFDFIKKSKDYGLQEILFSLHGWDETVHDKKVNHQGAYKKIISAMKNTAELDMILRINCTIEEDFNPEKYAELIIELNPYQINLLPLNYWNDAIQNNTINYLLLSEKIKRFIDILSETNIEINVRYIPFCFMKNYEKYCVGTYQHIFDLKDWNLEVYEKVTSQEVSKEQLFNQAKLNRKNTYIKPIECLKCSNVLLCDGIEYNLLSDNSLSPQDGKVIDDIMYYKDL